MPAKLIRQMDRLEALLEATLRSLQPLSEQQLEFKPARGAWSITETLQHLYLSEKGTYEFVAVGRDPKRMPAALTFDNPFRYRMMILALRLPLRFRAPVRSILPDGQIHLPNMATAWRELHANFRRFVTELPLEMYRAPVFIHAVFGFFDIYQTLRFQEEHFRHHLRQIKRIQKSPGFPR